jgi:hypothetical protein
VPSRPAKRSRAEAGDRRHLEGLLDALDFARLAVPTLDY